MVLGCTDLVRDDTFLKAGGDSFKAFTLMNHIETELNIFDIRILESILKDTFSKTCALLLTLLSGVDQLSSISRENQLKRKNSISLKGCVSEKIAVAERTSSIFRHVTCMNCGHSFVKNNKNAVVTAKNGYTITRGSRYHVHNEVFIINDRSLNEPVVDSGKADGSEIRLKQLWKYDTGKCVDASPLIAFDNFDKITLYIGSHSHKFSAIDVVSGKSKWEITLGDRIESSACLSRCQQFAVVGMFVSNTLFKTLLTKKNIFVAILSNLQKIVKLIRTNEILN